MTSPRIDGYTSEAEIPVPGGAPIKIRCDWAVVAAARQRFGKDWTRKLGEALDERDVEVLAEFVEVMSDGAVSKARVMELSPPMRPLTDAIFGCLMAANHGPDWRAEIAKDQEAGGGAAVPFGTWTLLSRLWARPSRAASPSPSSGASPPGSSDAPSGTSPANGRG